MAACPASRQVAEPVTVFRPCPQMATIYFITGTDTGVGKTVLTALLVRHLRAAGVRAVAVKPLCSGGREDAEALRQAQGGLLTLDEINPWHFQAPLAPVLAARIEGRKVLKQELLSYLGAWAARCDVLLVEGAGGLLSPLGEGFDARDLIGSLSARAIVAAPNRLGTVNQVRLVLAALPFDSARTSRVALTSIAPPNRATRTNADLLAEYMAPSRIALVPRVSWPGVLERGAMPVSVARAFSKWDFKNGNRA